MFNQIEIIEMKKLYSILFLICSLTSYADPGFFLKGKIIDSETNEVIIGAKINLYSGKVSVRSIYSNKYGLFEFTTTMPIDIIEVNFIGKLPMKLIEIDAYNDGIKRFLF